VSLRGDTGESGSDNDSGNAFGFSRLRQHLSTTLLDQVRALRNAGNRNGRSGVRGGVWVAGGEVGGEGGGGQNAEGQRESAVLSALQVDEDGLPEVPQGADGAGQVRGGRRGCGVEGRVHVDEYEGLGRLGFWGVGGWELGF
jgi:hypothetical protein